MNESPYPKMGEVRKVEVDELNKYVPFFDEKSQCWTSVLSGTQPRIISQTDLVLSEILTLLWDIAEMASMEEYLGSKKAWFRNISDKIQELHKKIK